MYLQKNLNEAQKHVTIPSPHLRDPFVVTLLQDSSQIHSSVANVAIYF